MAEYIGRDDLLNVINTNVAEAHNERCCQLLEAILNAPTADVVEVVRCKDCFYFKDFGECNRSGIECMADDFCSYGKRRDT